MQTVKRIAAMLLALVIIYMFARSAMADTTPHNRTSYIVQSSDTLWSIAQHFAPNANAWDEIDSIKQINHIGDDITPGERLVVPTK